MIVHPLADASASTILSGISIGAKDDVFSRHETAVDMVTTSEVSVPMTLDDARQLDAIV